MLARTFDQGQLGQAIYSWSTTRIDSTPGLGFIAISPLLVPHIAWLSNETWPEFKIEHGESRSGSVSRPFASVGRTRRGDVGILYRKSRNQRRDAKGRVSIFIHAVFGDATDLPVDLVDRVVEDFWLPEDTSERVRLVDLSSLPLAEMSQPGAATRPGGLKPTEDPSKLLVPSRDPVSAHALRIGGELRPWLCSDSFVFDGGVHRMLWVPNEPQLLELSGVVLDSSGKIDLLGTIRNASVASSADAAAGAGGHSAPAQKRGLDSAAVDIHKFLVDILGPGLDGTLSDTQAANLAVKLTAGGVRFEELAHMKGADSLAFFGGWDGSHVRDWVELSKQVPMETVVLMWNRQPSAMLLGVVMARIGEIGDLRPGLLSIGFVRESDAVVCTLRVTLASPGGMNALRRLASLGFFENEVFRKTVVTAVSGQPRLLFDGVLAWPQISTQARFEMIRLAWDSWVSYRRIPRLEAEALSWRFRSGLISRLLSAMTVMRRDDTGDQDGPGREPS